MNEEVKYTQKDLDLVTALTMAACVTIDKLFDFNYTAATIAICLFPLVYFFIRALSYFLQDILGVDKSED